eukprot:12408740-Karenia_brevis.AAC.1
MKDEIASINDHVQYVVVEVNRLVDVASAPLNVAGSDRSHVTTPVEEVDVTTKEIFSQSHASPVQVDAIAPQCPASPAFFDAHEEHLPDVTAKDLFSQSHASPVQVDAIAP